MTAFMFLIDQLAIGLYILIGIGLVLAWRSLGIAQRDFRETYFELERGLARYRRANAATMFILLIEAGLIIYGVQRVVVPVLAAQEEEINDIIEPVEDLPFNTPTPNVNQEVAIDDADVLSRIEATEPFEAIQATPTLTPTPVGTIVPNPGEIIGCDTDNASLQIPANGMIVFEPTDVRGVAFIDNFAFYRLELRGPSTFGEFAPLADYTQPVNDLTSLGQFVPGFFEPGEYQFRLNVFDIAGDVKATCTVNIIISEPIPTPTPLPQN
ncbi:MAG: hypothetical protein AAF787_22390 [Chloroflexota bacterium]